MTRTYRAIIRRPSGPPVRPSEALRRQMSMAYRRGVLTTCQGCGIAFPPSLLDVDHIQPLCRGGEDTSENLQILCRDHCHKAKTAMDIGRATVPIFVTDAAEGPEKVTVTNTDTGRAETAQRSVEGIREAIQRTRTEQATE